MSVLTTKRSVFVLGSLVAMAAVSTTGILRSQTTPQASAEIKHEKEVLSKAMARKLKSTQDLVKALAVEDFAQIDASAALLKQIGQDTLWKVSPNVTYIKYASEFSTISGQLAAAGRDKDLNAATLAYVRLTINCIDCHKFVRDGRILGEK